MDKPRVIIADTDFNYIIPLQLKFAKDFFNLIEVEVITEKEYFDKLFSKPQKAEILIVSENLYDISLQKHNIANTFLMVEQYEEGQTGDLNVVKLFKYTSIKEIFNEIVGRSSSDLNIESVKKQETQIVVVTSANGGAGKTTIAMGVSACLTQNYKRVLYINASRLQCFKHILDNHEPIITPDIYMKLANPTDYIYSDIRHVIRKEIFSYLPAFKASLLSVGIDYSIYRRIAVSAKNSGDFDFIIIDAESTFDEEKTRLLDISDKVILVTEQSVHAVEATNTFIANINIANTGKYIFVCNKFKKESYNALIAPNLVTKFTVNEYVDDFEVNGIAKCEELLQNNGIWKLSFLVV